MGEPVKVAAKPKAPKALKAKKASAKPSHPPTAQLVNNAIKALQERGGSSLQAIKKYIASNNKVDAEKLAPFIKRYLKKATVGGKLVQTKGHGASGSFKLSAKSAKPAKPKAAKKPKAKKPAAAKKAVAKKPAAKKSAAAKAKKPAAKKAAPAKPKAPKQKSTKKAAASKKPRAPKPKAAKPKVAPAKKAAKAKWTLDDGSTTSQRNALCIGQRQSKALIIRAPDNLFIRNFFV